MPRRTINCSAELDTTMIRWRRSEKEAEMSATVVPVKSSTSRRWMVVAAAFVVVAATVGIVIASRGGAEPRLNEGTTVLAKFVSTKDFDRLPFEKQRLYYKVLDDRGKELDDAFKQGRLTEAEYRNALEAAWLGKHLNRVEKYFALAPGSARANYINQLVTKKVKKDAKDAKPEKEER